MTVKDSKPFHLVLTFDPNESLDSSEIAAFLVDQHGCTEEEATKQAVDMLLVLEEMAWVKKHHAEIAEAI